MNISFLKQFVLTFIFCILPFYAINISLADPNIDLSINKVSSKTTVAPNDTVSYTVTFENKGSVDIPSSTASIKDFADKNNLDISSASFSGLSSGDYCSVTQDPDPLVAIFQGQYINCSLGSLPAGSKRSLTYTLKVKDNASIGNEIMNVAYISVPDEENSNKGNNSSQANVKVVASSTTNNNTQNSTSNNTVSNSSNNNTSTNSTSNTNTNIAVEDTENNASTSNNNNSNNETENSVNNSEDYSTIPSDESTSGSNSSDSDQTTQTTETTLANTITDVYNVDLSIVKSVNKSTAKVGDKVTYTLQYTNKGSHEASNVKITDFVDKDSLDLSDISFSSSACQVTVDSDPLVAIFQGEFILCNIGNLKANQTGILTYTLPVASNVANGKTIKNLANINTSSEDANKSNNSSSVSFVVGSTSTNNTNENQSLKSENTTQEDETETNYKGPFAEGVDLFIEKSTTTPKVKPTEKAFYTIKYINKGKLNATDVSIKDLIDLDKFDYTKIEFIEKPSGIDCAIRGDEDPLVEVFEGKVILCKLGVVKSGEIRTISYSIPLKSDVIVGETVNNTVKIDTSSTDLKSGNNFSTAYITVDDINSSNLKVTKTSENKNYHEGNKVKYTIKIENIGNLKAKNISLKDLSSGDRFKMGEIEYSGINSLFCKVKDDPDFLLAVFQGSHIECNIPEIHPNDSFEFSYVVPLQDDVMVGEVISNTVFVSSENETGIKSDNTDKAVINIVSIDHLGTSNLKVTKTSDRENYKKTDAVKYTVKIENIGDIKARNIFLKDLSSGDRFKMGEIEYSGINSLFCKVKDDSDLLLAIFQGSHIECNIPEIYPNDSFEFFYTVPLEDDVEVGEKISNTVSVSSENETGIKSDNTDTAVINIVESYSVSTPDSGSGTINSGAGTTGANNTISNVSSSGDSTTSQSFHGSASSLGSGGGCTTYSTIDLDIEAFAKDKTGKFVDADSIGDALEVANKSKVSYKVEVENTGTVSASKLKVLLNFGSLDATKYSITNIKNAELNGNIFTVGGLVNSNGKSEFTFDVEVKDSSLSKLDTQLSIVNYAVAYDCPKIKKSEGIGKKDNVYLEFNKTKYKLAKTVNKSEVKAGDEIEYTLLLKNTGDTDIKNVILYDVFPSQHLEPIGNSELRLVDKNTLKFKRKFLPAGDLFKVTVNMKVKDSVSPGTKIINILKSGSQTVEMKDTVKTIVTVINDLSDSGLSGKETVYGPKLNSDNLASVNKVAGPQRLVQTGSETPLIPLGISMILTGIWLYRRKNMA